MTDRELLEAAAKAAGIKASNYPDGIWRNTTDMHPSTNIFGAPRWNPITDDGDALRLAVKLEINLNWGAFDVVATEFSSEAAAREKKGSCPYAAIRRAIVRAAAESKIVQNNLLT